MCRHLCYIGPPVTLDELLLRPDHSLLEQTWAPEDMRQGGTVNVDGFGAGWYLPSAQEPVRYRSAVPMWTDANFGALAPTVASTAVLGSVRSATVGMPVTDTACAPFTDGTWLFSHNGRVSGWPDSVADLAAKLETTELMTLDAPVDSAVVWALLRHRLGQRQPAASAVRETVREIVTVAPQSRMNLLLTDGTTVIATTWTHSLSVRKGSGSVTVASEPFGPASGWEPVADGRLLVADPDHVSVTALDESDTPL